MINRLTNLATVIIMNYGLSEKTNIGKKEKSTSLDQQNLCNSLVPAVV